MPIDWLDRTRLPLSAAAPQADGVWQGVQVPEISRQAGFHLWCWAAVAQMVHRWSPRVAPLTQCEIAGQTLKVADCCGPGAQACNQEARLQDALAVVNNLDQGPLPPMSYEQVREEIVDYARPVPIRVQFTLGHFVLLRQVRDGAEPWVELFDPEPGRGTSRLPFSGLQQGSYGKWTHSFRVVG